MSNASITNGSASIASDGLPSFSAKTLPPPMILKPLTTLSSLVRAFGPMFWIMLLFVPYIFHTDQKTRTEYIEKDFERVLQAMALLSFGLCQVAGGAGPIFMGIRRALINPAGLGIILCFAMIFAFSVFSIDPFESAAYSVATCAAFVLCSIAWYGNERQLPFSIGWLGWILAAFLIFLTVLLGWNFDYHTIGGMHHNLCGAAFCTVIVCLHYGQKRFRWPATAICLVMVLLSSSRSSLLFATTFLLMIAVLRPWRFRAVLYILLGGTAVAFAATALTLAGSDVLWKIADETFALSDRNRGVGSGMTGRTTLWTNAVHTFQRRPIIGYGYRTRAPNADTTELPNEANGHSAYLNMLLDVGLLGTIPFVTIVVGSCFVNVRRTIRTYRVPGMFRGSDLPATQVLCRGNAAFLAATLVTWTIEPSYFNLGLPETAFLFIVLMAPLSVPQSAGAARSRSARQSSTYRGGASGWRYQY